MRTLCAAFACLWQLPGCATAERAACDDPVPRIVSTKGSGAEDIVALPLANGHTRLFVREVCRSLLGCDYAQNRIGYVDIDSNVSPQASETKQAWRLSGDEQEFEPLGLSLIPGEKPGFGLLFLIDAVKPVRIWRLAIDHGVVTRADQFWPDKKGIESDPIESANDLHADGDSVYVSRFDFLGILSWRSGAWPGDHSAPQGRIASRARGRRARRQRPCGYRIWRRSGRRRLLGGAIALRPREKGGQSRLCDRKIGHPPRQPDP